MPARRRLCSALTAAALTLCGLATAVMPPATAAGSGEFCGPGWQRVSTPAVQQHSTLADLAGDADDLWAVGEHHRRNRGEHAFAIHWDGQSWSKTATVDRTGAAATRLEGVAALTHDDVWAVGIATFTTTGDHFFTEHWNGSSWSAVPTPDVGESGQRLYAVDGVAADDVWAVGTRGSGSARTAVLHWDGDTWSVVPSPSSATKPNYLTAVDAVSATEAWAFGVTGVGDDAVALVLRWNGTSWSKVAAATDAPQFTWFTDGAVAPDGDVWTAGGAPWRSSTTPEAVLQHREGGTWTTHASPGEPWLGVSPVSDSDVWLAGYSATAHWNGSSTTRLDVPPVRGDVVPSMPLTAVEAIGRDQVWVVGGSEGPTGTTTIPVTMRLCPLSVTDDGIDKESSRVSQGSGTIWRFPAANDSAHDVTDALDLGASSTPLFGTGRRTPGSTGTFTLNHAGTFPVVDTATGHTSELTVPTEAIPKVAPLGTTFTVYTAASTSSLGSFLGSDVRYRKPGSEFWYRLASGTRSAQTAFTPDQKGTYTFQARLRNRTTGVVSGWSPFATVKVTAT